MVRAASDFETMRVTVIHSPTAGAGHPTRMALLDALARAGHEAVYWSSGAEWRTGLGEATDLVVAAGGDGTVKNVALALATAGQGVPLAVLPAGTANNIALTLGTSGPLEDLVSTWRDARRMRLDVGLIRGPWGEKRFIEGVGFGAFARTIRDADDLRAAHPEADETDRDERLNDDLRMLQKQVQSCIAVPATFVLDGEALTGRYILAAVMSIRSLGPNLMLAPSADPGDGMLDVALVPHDAREELEVHLARRIDGASDAPGVFVRRARRISVRWDGPDVHFDGEIWPKRRDRLGAIETPLEVEIELTGESVEALCPRLPLPAPGRVAVT
jgi:diacylglycerol kinase family enzyme